MVGKGLLFEALEDSRVQEIILLSRQSIGLDHPKMKELILKDFSDIPSLASKVNKVDACYHCMGVSSVGMSEDQYSALTFDITKDLADLMYSNNPQMTFCYVSGTGTDSSENGKVMWARVKGRTENYILHKGFGKAIMFRPGAILPEKGIRSKTSWYNWIYIVLRPFFPLMKKMKSITTTTKLGQAMLYAPLQSSSSKHLENPEINLWAEEYQSK